MCLEFFFFFWFDTKFIWKVFFFCVCVCVCVFLKPLTHNFNFFWGGIWQAVPHSLWDLSFPTKDQTQGLGSESTEF